MERNVFYTGKIPGAWYTFCMAYIRLSKIERNALSRALADFQGEAYVFGSRIDPNKRGGDIDILLKPAKKVNRYVLKSNIVSSFGHTLEQSLDVVVFDEQSPFCQEIIKHAQPLDLARV